MIDNQERKDIALQSFFTLLEWPNIPFLKHDFFVCVEIEEEVKRQKKKNGIWFGENEL